MSSFKRNKATNRTGAAKGKKPNVRTPVNRTPRISAPKADTRKNSAVPPKLAAASGKALSVARLKTGAAKASIATGASPKMSTATAAGKQKTKKVNVNNNSNNDNDDNENNQESFRLEPVKTEEMKRLSSMINEKVTNVLRPSVYANNENQLLSESMDEDEARWFALMVRIVVV